MTDFCANYIEWVGGQTEGERETERESAYLAAAAAAACECHSDPAVRKAANTEAYKQTVSRCHMWALWPTYTNTFLLKRIYITS